VLERRAPGTWGLRVKSSSVKDHYSTTLRSRPTSSGRGPAITSIELLHVNTKYVRGQNGIAGRIHPP
jgi:hypothetical protein